MKTSSDSQPQIDKPRNADCDLETDDREEVFDAIRGREAEPGNQIADFHKFGPGTAILGHLRSSGFRVPLRGPGMTTVGQAVPRGLPSASARKALRKETRLPSILAK